MNSGRRFNGNGHVDRDGSPRRAVHSLHGLQDLTAEQAEVLQVIGRHVRDAGRPPLMAELSRALGRNESTLRFRLARLQLFGFVSVNSGGRGTSAIINLTSKGKLATRRPGMPVLGWVVAGVPVDAQVAEVVDYIETIDDLLPDHRDGDFFLVVQGNSMLNDGILPGDKVWLRPDVQIENGEIAAVQLCSEAGTEAGEDRATLKRVHFSEDGARVTLRASNPLYADIELPAEELRVAGVYRGLVRDRRSTCQGNTK